jgi:hypothetical protein
VAAAVDVRPPSLIAVVGAIARQVPEAAPAAAAKAASLRPKQLSEITASAASAAPGQAAKIVEVLCKAMPTQYPTIATAAAKAVPSATKEILLAVTAAVPALKPFLDRATTDLARDASMTALMSRTEMLVGATASEAKTTPEKVLAGGNSGGIAGPLPPPTLGPPFTELPQGENPGTVTRTQTRVVPDGGGRDYSTP